ncbi:SDR family oxidoreductase [Gracilibacillus oryzae]|uniref:SDR family oxidoreductase n=1 Tax=Gracilibacillus oryzae TaxID=1672701 RepID=A0A7C8GVB0_9BACI|nr:SDR family oxidoreductase [Gracilibacillus oryzae]KAB8138971.1 SDR family oxidoreductase [Gracilibacillus oryzae]
MSFQNKAVIVTGGSNGIGEAVVKAYLAEGAFVINADKEEPAFHHANLYYIKTDVSNPNDIEQLFSQIDNQFNQIDILINNAGISRFSSFYDLTVEEWDQVINTNLRSVFLCSQAAARRMRNNKNGGSLVHIASTRAFMSEPDTESYAASKGGIYALTHALAMTLQEDRITSNSISPGWIETTNYDQLRSIDHEQHPSNRVGNPEDIAKACLFLTNSSNNFINGENLTIDGGMTKKMIYEH